MHKIHVYGCLTVLFLSRLHFISLPTIPVQYHHSESAVTALEV